MSKSFTCSCGKKVKSIRYQRGKKVCESCSPTSLSGQWERRAMNDRMHFEKDLLQAYNKDGSRNQNFIDAYGTKYYEKNKKK